jgi:hypothetical protein
MSRNYLKREVYVTISSEEHEAPLWTFSTIPGLMDMSMGIVGEIFLNFPSENTSCADSGMVEMTTMVDGV